jgi:hypothetical protein
MTDGWVTSRIMDVLALGDFLGKDRKKSTPQAWVLV